MAINERILEAILSRNLSVRQVSHALGIPNSTLNRQINHGGLDAEHAAMIARHLNLSLDELAGLSPPSGQALSADESAVIDLYRALGLTKPEALRALSYAARVVAGQPIVPNGTGRDMNSESSADSGSRRKA